MRGGSHRIYNHHPAGLLLVHLNSPQYGLTSSYAHDDSSGSSSRSPRDALPQPSVLDPDDWDVDNAEVSSTRPIAKETLPMVTATYWLWSMCPVAKQEYRITRTTSPAKETRPTSRMTDTRIQRTPYKSSGQSALRHRL